MKTYLQIFFNEIVNYNKKVTNRLIIKLFNILYEVINKYSDHHDKYLLPLSKIQNCSN